jgi:cytochrome c
MGKKMRSILMAAIVALLAAAGPAIAQDALPEGRADAGAAVFKKCMACHQVGPKARNGIGPALNGVVGRKAGSYPGYKYSPANLNSDLKWDDQTLARYLRAPGKVVPGTKMVFVGLKKEQEIADVIAHLKQFDEKGERHEN